MLLILPLNPIVFEIYEVSGAIELSDPANSAEILQRLQNSDKARFSDTSWQIHRTWARNGDPLQLSPPPSREDISALPASANAANVSATLRKDQNGIYDTITVSSHKLNITLVKCEDNIFSFERLQVPD
ncbi:unnamed protein product [Euphydryas editha]|uniref:Uncharacterized protein n=1 Tax=Euphydryas editha TaxID=104508 RepID=A0AAU9UYU1_EUPED|nr:unnamed protein product [Euphydryas editha]